MLLEIQSIINNFSLGSASASVAGGQGAEFEMWILLKMADRLRNSPYMAELRDCADIPIKSGTTFSLRGAPGRIGSGAACHVHFLWHGVPHEIHANAQFRGRSTETHEVDIAIIPASLAADLRAMRGGYPTGQPRVAIECKFKSSTGSKDEARQVIARQFDMNFLFSHPYPWSGRKYLIWPEANASSGYGNSVMSYMQSFKRCFNAICRIGAVTRNTGIYLAFNAVVPFQNLKPGKVETIEFLNELESFLSNHTP